MGANIPLPALQLHPVPQGPDILEQMGKLQALKYGQGQQQLQQQTMQSNQLKIQDEQQDQQDRQTMMQVIGQHGGNIESALPDLAGKISTKTFVPLQKSVQETKKNFGEMHKTELENEKNQADQLLGLITQAKQLPPDQYQQAWPQIAARAVQIEPRVGAQINPGQLIPQSLLDGISMGIASHTQLAGAELEKRQQADEARKAQEFADKQPGGSLYAPTEAALAVKAAAGDADAEAALKRLDQSKRASRPIINTMSGNDVKDIADAIENGDQPPNLTGLYRNAGPVRAELARRGVPIAKMETDWKATQRYMSTLNGSQQVRLRQSIESASGMLDKIDGLYQEWQQIAPTSGFKMLNRAALTAMKNLPGRAGAVANALDAQIADLTADLGNVYMGGNSPTDHSLSLAGQNLKSEWNQQTFEEGLKQARANLKIRQNSILHGGPAGVSADSPYLPPAPPAEAAKPWEKYPVHQ